MSSRGAPVSVRPVGFDDHRPLFGTQFVSDKGISFDCWPIVVSETPYRSITCTGTCNGNSGVLSHVDVGHRCFE